ncbi:hypothetical protein DdX_03258 [Ditylenchus destructor]|uniref:tRNA-splicing endonuclease subunit Sen54 n=1 Tax=Ditylenchus destructor TaxID=166010 RepID=A0AAD4NHM3_9BILA|nr:hypothetical protein DdX_03258 [Ditylenchus destructor]
MGFPRRNLHYLYVEEALYLVQNELAIALFDGKRLSLPHLYQLLGTLNVSLLKYSAFSALIQAGYAVKRPAATCSYHYNVLGTKTSAQYRLLVSDQKFNEVPDVEQLKKIFDEQSDVPLLIASGTPENLRISKFSAQSESLSQGGEGEELASLAAELD